MSMYIAEPPLQILFWKILSPPAFLEQFTDFLVTKSDVRYMGTLSIQHVIVTAQ